METARRSLVFHSPASFFQGTITRSSKPATAGEWCPECLWHLAAAYNASPYCAELAVRAVLLLERNVNRQGGGLGGESRNVFFESGRYRAHALQRSSSAQPEHTLDVLKTDLSGTRFNIPKQRTNAFF